MMILLVATFGCLFLINTSEQISSLALNSGHIRYSNYSSRHEMNRDFTGCPYNNDFYTTGLISSPFYPNNYGNNLQCFYFLQATIGYVVRITFVHFDLETCCDYVSVFDGPTWANNDTKVYQ